MAEKLSVIAKFTAKPGREKDVLLGLKEMIAPTRLEEGCINYDLHESRTVPGVFYFYENWTGKDVLDKHLVSAHIQNALKKIEGFLREPIELHLMDEVKA